MRIQNLKTAGLVVIASALVLHPRFGAAQVSSTATDKAIGATLEEVVVTAKKRLENIQSVAASVSVISGKSLEADHATQLEDYAAYVPGLQVDNGGSPGQTTITLRGIAPLGSGSEVGTYIDDAPLGPSGLYALAVSFQLDLLPYDLNQVEVLRGPQGTLYGASSMGGLLKYSLKAPNMQSFQAEIGTDVFGVAHGGGPGYGVRAMVNEPVTDKLAIRASYFDESTPGFINNPVRNKGAINGVTESGGRLAVEWTPDEDLKILLQALNQTVHADDDAVVALDPQTERPAIGALGSNLPLAQPFEQTTNFYDATLSWRTGIGTLTSVFSKSDTRNRQTQDDTLEFASLTEQLAGSRGYVPYTSSVDIDKYTWETRLASPTSDRVEWLAGTFETYEQGHNVQVAPELDAGGQPGPLNPLLTASLPTTYREWAVFGDVTIHLLPQFDLSGGLRFAENNQRYEQIFGGMLLPPGSQYGRSSDQILTYSVSPQYKLSKNVMLYARVATGYQPGGPNVGGLPGVPASVSPSTLINYEAGLKGEFIHKRLLIDVTGYRMDWSKIQTVATNADGVGYLINGGTARSTGVEFNSSFVVVPHLTAGLNFAYTDAAFTSRSAGLGVGAGQPLPFVPRYSGSATLDYTHHLNDSWTATAGLGVRYTGARQADLFLAPAPPLIFPESAYTAVDIHAGLTHGPWRVGLYAKNLLDDRSYITKVGETDAVTGALIRIGGTVLQPLTVGLSLDRSF